MTRLFNDPLNFATDVLSGIGQAYARYIRTMPGGVVRATGSPAGEVAVVIGGGSGHFPAFSGWVGPGLAHGAAQGNVFASPSASQIYAVCKSADNGGGILLTFGNYAGDVLHFGQAAERLRAEGIEVRVVPVSDDVASNTPDKARDRRGTTGDLPVFKIAAAAAERGRTLDEVEALAWRVNDRTRSLGVAFGGCTLPGASAPLFTVPEGQMSIGLGVHGEPGVREIPMGSSRDVGKLLVEAVLSEEPPRSLGGYEGRAIVLLNGLGTVKYEELYTVYGEVARLLDEAGITPVLPEVGELMSSLDMAGLSLTLTYLDPELEELWTDPVDTISFRRGRVEERTLRQLPTATFSEPDIVPGSAESRGQADRLAEVLAVIAETAVQYEPELGRIDAVAGDGDHGQGMVLGSSGALNAARTALKAGAGASTLLVRAGAQWAESAGGTSGALWGSALTAVGGEFRDTNVTDASGVVRAVTAGIDAVLRLGGAVPGDKTMVDALVPFRDTLRASFETGQGLPASWTVADEAADAAAQATAGIIARRGRSRVLGAKSLGTPDPGALSFALIMKAIVRSGLLDDC